MAKAVNQDRETTSIALDNDEGEDEESIASSVYENSIESPAKPPPPQAERLRALDASLKAMEAEDDTGTLSKLKASLQHELEAKSDDDGHYGSDFEEDFEEDAIAR
ncbi:hypothetical protein DYB25_004044 [Aphanomyces astaci]|uniref:Uncharacterized protein n=1 Tax=Aphanomyces astaci TaxID=112090 RepID=A0A397ABD1_APHAT|nr:hypothetical protein DYB36_002434 [Aphanomyces astaci]RHY22220.1 hypothetical protein DYB25_004044 [Aphanomyces astaci]RHY37081.1 hypothetical protein DYB38_002987 [Aphanomyces astaci]RHY50206.1 hypothetical protein DYB34_005973 [Aphanomyces astaci]RHY55752.1 hypothetical protein DYB30_005922 [Aphanomyces astaci]